MKITKRLKNLFAGLKKGSAWASLARAWQASDRAADMLSKKLRPRLDKGRDGAAPALAALKRFFVSQRTRKWLKTGGLAVLAFAVLAGAAFFSLRDTLLRSVLDGRLRSYSQHNPGTMVEVGTAKFRGLASVEMDRLRFRSPAAAVDLGRCRVSVSLWKLLVGQMRLKSLELADLRVALNRPGTGGVPVSPTGRAQEKKPLQPATTAGRPPDFGAGAARFLDLYFNRIPDRLVIERLFIHTAFAGVQQALYVPRLAIGGPSFRESITVFDQGEKWSCTAAGGVERGRRRLTLRLEPGRNGKDRVPLPFLGRQWGLKTSFDALTIALQSRGRQDGALRLDGSLAVSGLALNHPRIAAADVDLESAALDFSLRIGPETVELVAPSRVAFNRLAFQPAIKFVARPSRQFVLKVPKTRFAADDLFASLPAGLFTHLAGIRTSGELAFHFDFAIDLDRPEALVLDVGLDKRNFRILRFGAANLRHFAGPFLYTAYEKDRPVRSFVVGPENPSFRFLESIPAYLQHAVMISEDGAFFSHRGFLLEPFKNSIVINLRAGRFVRGASTISMQLVKNLYLRRHKTIARKLEELLITWLIEENRLVSKGRMLETYLNIIEWGPGVYGCQEAARFYFDKEVGQLTLAEAIFMAAIVPRPKRFMGFFGDDQRLRPWLQRYYADVSRKMLARGWISQSDYDTLLPEVTLTGPARMLLRGAEVEEEAAAEDLGVTIGGEVLMPDR